jgi:hypothetical protein
MSIRQTLTVNLIRNIHVKNTYDTYIVRTLFHIHVCLHKYINVTC